MNKAARSLLALGIRFLSLRVAKKSYGCSLMLQLYLVREVSDDVATRDLSTHCHVTSRGV
jgi:hypothetical protein